jgi:hypothetical protein
MHDLVAAAAAPEVDSPNRSSRNRQSIIREPHRIVHIDDLAEGDQNGFLATAL